MFNVKWFNSKAGASGAFAGKLSQPTTQLRQQWEIDAQNADIDLNNPSSMLRYVISQMAEMRGQLKALQPTSRAPRSACLGGVLMACRPILAGPVRGGRHATGLVR